MSAVSQTLSFDSSASSHFDGHDDPYNYKVKNCLKDLLKSRIFFGRYLERRLADKRIGYRDIVLISPAEIELKKDLLEVENKLRCMVPSMYWIGITEAEAIGYPAGVCIWTEIDNQPFGTFWFQIRGLKFRDDEIIVTVKCLRHISESFLEMEPILNSIVKKKNETTDNNDSSITSQNETCTDFLDTLKSFLSISNVKDFVTFLFAFVIAIFTGSTSFLSFLGNFILALIRETSILIKNSTPMFLGLLDFFSKIIGGFYILLAMLFRQSTPVGTDKRSLAHKRSVRNSYQYDDKFD